MPAAASVNEAVRLTLDVVRAVKMTDAPPFVVSVAYRSTRFVQVSPPESDADDAPVGDTPEFESNCAVSTSSASAGAVKDADVIVPPALTPTVPDHRAGVLESTAIAKRQPSISACVYTTASTANRIGSSTCTSILTHWPRHSG